MWQELYLLNPVYTDADKLDQFTFLGNCPHPFPKPLFCPKREVSVNVSLGEG